MSRNSCVCVTQTKNERKNSISLDFMSISENVIYAWPLQASAGDILTRG